jgi:hypothetical protein
MGLSSIAHVRGPVPTFNEPNVEYRSSLGTDPSARTQLNWRSFMDDLALDKRVRVGVTVLPIL